LADGGGGVNGGAGSLFGAGCDPCGVQRCFFEAGSSSPLFWSSAFVDESDRRPDIDVAFDRTPARPKVSAFAFWFSRNNAMTCPAGDCVSAFDAPSPVPTTQSPPLAEISGGRVGGAEKGPAVGALASIPFPMHCLKGVDGRSAGSITGNVFGAEPLITNEGDEDRPPIPPLTLWSAAGGGDNPAAAFGALLSTLTTSSPPPAWLETGGGRGGGNDVGTVVGAISTVPLIPAPAECMAAGDSRFG